MENVNNESAIGIVKISDEVVSVIAGIAADEIQGIVEIPHGVSSNISQILKGKKASSGKAVKVTLEEDKAIVTDIAGTTRDIVEGETIINGIKINFLDTAGIRETANVVEKIGVDKSKKIINTADLIILVLNNNEKLTPDDLDLLDLIKDKNYIIFVNKNDLPANIDLPIGKYTNVVYGNTLTTAGIKELKEMITTIFNLEKINTNDPTYITNARHKALIEVALNYLNSALENIDNGYSVDMLEIDIRACWDTLGEIIGATYKDELLDELFSNFCLGK